VIFNDKTNEYYTISNFQYVIESSGLEHFINVNNEKIYGRSIILEKNSDNID
jgi:hypothetical protein